MYAGKMAKLNFQQQGPLMNEKFKRITFIGNKSILEPYKYLYGHS